MGQIEEAKQAYLDVLTRCPAHVGALNNLGTLLYITGYRTAARSAYTEAIRQHPDQPMAHVNLGNLFLEAGELAAAREHYEAALVDRFPIRRGAPGLGESAGRIGAGGSRGSAPAPGSFGIIAPPSFRIAAKHEPVSVLLLISGRRGDVPIRHLLDDKVFRTFVVLPNVYDPDAPLPEHQVVFNAIGDADSLQAGAGPGGDADGSHVCSGHQRAGGGAGHGARRKLAPAGRDAGRGGAA